MLEDTDFGVKGFFIFYTTVTVYAVLVPGFVYCFLYQNNYQSILMHSLLSGVILCLKNLTWESYAGSRAEQHILRHLLVW